MMEKWRQNPRWTTAHTIKRDFLVELTDKDFWNPTIVLATVFPLEDIRTACELAYEVFFAFHVLPYEREKEYINGTI